ncbi:hypothetical protein [Plantactinospora endophytica]|uniref:Lipoprotein n=1 Tax=Plantactinospora endophytica TaxID=673535 RepID=A0ABQ4E7P1_9ACTN|nr:hypothetical protein [Plantactinospora endophytica]GIG90744.1 hypothetical protein Pen02_56800 [Plantactinospora endophytica]
MLITKALRRLPQAAMGIGLGLIVAASAPTAVFAEQQQSPAPNGDLTVEVRDAKSVQGKYGLAGSLVEYDAKRTGTDQATVTVTVNGVVLTATVDYAARTGSWKADGKILGAEGKTALAGMEKALAGQFRPGKAVLGPHEALLHRAVNYWSEAPAGYVLTGDSFKDVKESDVPKPLTDAKGAPLPQAEECLNPATGEQSAAACQEANEDGILYTGCSGSHAECHDANGHCHRCTAVAVGKSVNCKGRCGGGCCVPDGLGIYTYDCLDHDQCCGDHGGCLNPWDGECGDEYGEADEDFLLGRQNCGWQC